MLDGSEEDEEQKHGTSSLHCHPVPSPTLYWSKQVTQPSSRLTGSSLSKFNSKWILPMGWDQEKQIFAEHHNVLEVLSKGLAPSNLSE